MFKKKLFLGLLVFFIGVSFLPFYVNAEDALYSWARRSGGTGGDSTYSASLDSAGNIYVAGDGNITDSGDPDYNTLTMNAVISKYDPNGNLVWTKEIKGAGGLASSYEAVVSGADLYVLATFWGTVDANPDPGEDSPVTSLGNNDILLVKFDLNGEHVWSKSFGGTGEEAGWGITTKTVQNITSIYVTGNYSGTVDFDPALDSTVTKTNPGAVANTFVSKFTSNGDFEWVKTFDGTGTNTPITGTMIIDGDNNLLIAGYFDGKVDFDPGVLVNESITVPGFGAYIVKLDSNGDFGPSSWFKVIGTPIGVENRVFTQSITIDTANNIYVTGSFESASMDFNPGAGGEALLTSQYVDIFVLKLTSGGDYVWAVKQGGPGYDVGYDISLDNLGNVYNAGSFEATGDFDPAIGTNMNLVSAGSLDTFISKLDSAGAIVWAVKQGGLGFDVGYDISLDNLGNVYHAGSFEATADFGTSSLVSAGAGDSFLLKRDFTSPTLSSSTPADGSLDASLTSNLVLTFNEAIAVGTGNIVIKKVSDDTVVETIDVTSGAVTGGGTATITINPVNEFSYDTAYYVNIDATAFDDIAGHSYAGISDNTTFNFQTMAQPQTSSGSIPRPRSTVTVSVGCTTGQAYSPTTGGKCTSWTAVVENNPEVKDNNTTQLENGKYNFGTILIRLGSRGESCRAWQSFFNSRGMKLVEDGICGKLTIAAAKQWQLSVGLVSDGLLGVLSRAKAQE